jgi:hypothetical protein
MGHTELKPELAAVTLAYYEEANKRGDDTFAVRALLEAGSDQSYKKYLAILDATPPTLSNTFWGGTNEVANRMYTELLQSLFAEHGPDFFKRVGALLESKSLPERQVGVGALMATLQWSFGFNAADFAAERATRLQRLRPILKRLASMTVAERREYARRTKSSDTSSPRQIAAVPYGFRSDGYFDF